MRVLLLFSLPSLLLLLLIAGAGSNERIARRVDHQSHLLATAQNARHLLLLLMLMLLRLRVKVSPSQRRRRLLLLLLSV